MKTLLLATLTSMAILFFGCNESSVEREVCALKINSDTASKVVKVLLIGNSHTFFFDVPKTLRLMAKSANDSMYTSQVTPGGYTFQQHVSRKVTFDVIREEPWDFVVLQGQGAVQGVPPFLADSLINPYARILADSIRKNASRTKIILYMTHGYRNGVLTFNDTTWCNDDPQVCNYEGMHDRIKQNYLILSKQIDAEIAPSGVMWKILLDQHSEIDLFDPDGVHATPNGSYVAACSIYSLIFNKKPNDLYIPGNLTESNALLIQRTVTRSLFDCSPNWRTY